MSDPPPGGLTYQAAGVDLEAADEAVDRIRAVLAEVAAAVVEPA